jgi:hypothetical protein
VLQRWKASFAIAGFALDDESEAQGVRCEGLYRADLQRAIEHVPGGAVQAAQIEQQDTWSGCDSCLLPRRSIRLAQGDLRWSDQEGSRLLVGGEEPVHFLEELLHALPPLGRSRVERRRLSRAHAIRSRTRPLASYRVLVTLKADAMQQRLETRIRVQIRKPWIDS